MVCISPIEAPHDEELALLDELAVGTTQSLGP